MSYTIRDRNERLRDQRHSRTLVSIVSFFILIGIGIILRHPIQSLYLSLRGGAGVVTETVSNKAKLAVTSKRALLVENESLRAQITERESREAYVRVIEDENESLREILSYHAEKPEPHIAGVIGKPSENLYNRLLLDRGTNAGIFEGNHVGLQGTILLGTIVSVSANSAIVELYSSPSTSVNGMLRTQGIPIPVRGNGGGNFEIEVPRDITVADGDVITLADRPDMVIAVVKSVVFDPRDPFQTVLARTPVNVQELKYVEVIQ